MATPRQSPSGTPLKLGQRFSWSAEGLAEDTDATLNWIPVPGTGPLVPYIGSDIDQQLAGAQRIIHNGALRDGNVTIFNYGSGETPPTPEANGDIIVHVRVGKLFNLSVAVVAMLPEVARLTIPQASPLLGQQGTEAAVKVFKAWTSPETGLPIDTINVTEDDYVLISIDTPETDDLGTVMVTVDWLLQ